MRKDFSISMNPNQDWSSELIEALKAEGPTMSCREFEMKYSVSQTAAYRYAKRYGVKFLSALTWTPEHIEILRNSKTVREAEQALGRENRSILRKAYMIGKTFPKYVPPKQERPEPKPVPIKKAAYNGPSVLIWCKTCGCPVSNQVEHSQRVGCRRIA